MLFLVEAARRQCVFVPNPEEMRYRLLLPIIPGTISLPYGDETLFWVFETQSPISQVDLELAGSQE